MFALNSLRSAPISLREPCSATARRATPCPWTGCGPWSGLWIRHPQLSMLGVWFCVSGGWARLYYYRCSRFECASTNPSRALARPMQTAVRDLGGSSNSTNYVVLYFPSFARSADNKVLTCFQFRRNYAIAVAVPRKRCNCAPFAAAGAFRLAFGIENEITWVESCISIEVECSFYLNLCFRTGRKSASGQHVPQSTDLIICRRNYLLPL